METGWIKLYRCSIGSRVFNNEGLLKVWIWCLLKANHSTQWVNLKTGKGSIEVECKDGQFIFGRNSAAKELNMDGNTVWKRMQKLKNMENINIESNKQYSIISIMNWHTYQLSENESNNQSNKQVTSKQQASNTNKNDKNVKNEKKNIFDFDAVWKRYPNKDGKKAAEKHFNTTVKTEDDYTSINKALDTYLNHLKIETWKKPKNGSTWFNNWQDWVDMEIQEPRDEEIKIGSKTFLLTESEFKRWDAGGRRVTEADIPIDAEGNLIIQGG